MRGSEFHDPDVDPFSEESEERHKKKVDEEAHTWDPKDVLKEDLQKIIALYEQSDLLVRSFSLDDDAEMEYSVFEAVSWRLIYEFLASKKLEKGINGATLQRDLEDAINRYTTSDKIPHSWYRWATSFQEVRWLIRAYSMYLRTPQAKVALQRYYRDWKYVEEYNNLEAENPRAMLPFFQPYPIAEERREEVRLLEHELQKIVESLGGEVFSLEVLTDFFRGEAVKIVFMPWSQRKEAAKLLGALCSGDNWKFSKDASQMVYESMPGSFTIQVYFGREEELDNLQRLEKIIGASQSRKKELSTQLRVKTANANDVIRTAIFEAKLFLKNIDKNSS